MTFPSGLEIRGNAQQGVQPQSRPYPQSSPKPFPIHLCFRMWWAEARHVPFCPNFKQNYDHGGGQRHYYLAP